MLWRLLEYIFITNLFFNVISYSTDFYPITHWNSHSIW